MREKASCLIPPCTIAPNPPKKGGGGTPNPWAVIVSFTEFILFASIPLCCVPLCHTAWMGARRRKKGSKSHEGSRINTLNSHVLSSFQTPSHPFCIKLCGFAGTMKGEARSTPGHILLKTIHISKEDLMLVKSRILS